ncbi:MAG: InlB B-repeat-containing protein, partial [Anaeroplasmataceae bacterium]|nr:InlB B-repeat-containing protein [Anaeroplasmataceae bacterium]
MKKKRNILIIASCSFVVCVFFIVFGVVYHNTKDKDDDRTEQVVEYTVTFEANGGSVVSSKTVKLGEKVSKPTGPTREGYDFKGWFKESACTNEWKFDTDTVTENTTLYAKWEPKKVPPTPTEKYSITYVSEHGEKPEDVEEATALPLELPELADVEGWHFVGWYTTENFAEGSEAEVGVALTEDVTLYAKWEPKKVPPTPTEKYSITYVSEHGEKPEDVEEATALPLELPELADVEGWHFVGWYATENFAEGSEAEAGVALTEDVTLYAKWISLSAYEIFVSKGNIIYANDFIKAEEIYNSNIMGNFEKYEETYSKWFGTINDYDDFDELNKVLVQNGYLNVVDNSNKTTSAILILNPVYSSVIEVKTVIQLSTVAENQSIFTIMSPFSSSEYLLNLKTNAAKEICLQTRIYDATKDEYEDSILPASGGFAYVENKDLVIEVTFDLSTGEITVILSQEGKTKIFTETIDKEGYEKHGLPLTFSGVQVMTVEDTSQSIKMDWLGVRIVSENVEALKALVLAQLEANYEDYDKSEYTQQLELLEKTYADGVAAIEACTTNAEVLEALNEIEEAFYKIKSDSQLEAEAMLEVALQELAELKEEYKNSYTITKDSEDDYFANKESFDELFENAFRNLENPWSVEAIQNEVAYVRNALTGEDAWLQNDDTILDNYRQYLTTEARNYGWENGFSDDMDQVEQEIIAPLEEDLAALNTKEEMKACYDLYLELFDSIETKSQILARTKQEACTEVEEYAELAIEDLDAQIDAELIAEIGNVKDNAILAINNATTIEEVDYIKNTAENEISDLASFSGWSLEDIILYAKMELEDYINQKKSNYNQEYALNALDQVWIDHQYDFDGLKTVVKVIEKLKELKAMVDAITESNITITYSYDDAVDTVTYAFGSEIDRRIRVGDADERFVWLEEDTNQEFDFSSVLPNQSYTLCGQWHDIIKKINEFHRWDYSSVIPENNDIIEYTFGGDEVFMETFGIAMSGESNENRNIKITLPSKGRIVVFLDNFTNESPIAFIDTSINIT